MITNVAVLNQYTSEDFSVTDQAGTLKNNIPISEFSFHLFDPDDTEVSSSITYGFKNLGDGHYRFSFIPDKIGVWYLVIYHSTYFSTGKYGTTVTYENEEKMYGAIGILNEEFAEDFSVLDLNSNLLSGISLSEFTYDIFDPFDNDVSSSISISFSELGYGHYRAKYTPDDEGNWYLIVYHPTYFPSGKASSLDVFSEKTIADLSQGGAYGIDYSGSTFDFNRRAEKRKRILLRKISNNDKKPSIKIKRK